MAINYKVVSKRPGGIAAKRPPKYYPVLTKRRVATTRDIIDKIQGSANVSSPEIVAVLELLRTVIPSLLGSGHNVRLDGLGTFSIHARSKGKDTPEEVTSRDIDSLNISFLPDKDIKRRLNTVKFNKVK